MNQLKLYIDEDAMNGRLIAALRARAIEVITHPESGLGERSDEEYLVFATKQNCVLYTFNVSDFYRLHTRWVNSGREHAGMILAPQQRFSVGEQLRRIVCLHDISTMASMRNHLEFLGNWADDGKSCAPRNPDDGVGGRAFSGG